MARIRRRIAIEERQQGPTDEQRAAWRLSAECMKAKLARMALENNREHPDQPIHVDPADVRSDRWWLTTPGIDDLTRYRELCWRGAWDWTRDAHRVRDRVSPA